MRQVHLCDYVCAHTIKQGHSLGLLSQPSGHLPVLRVLSYDHNLFSSTPPFTQNTGYLPSSSITVISALSESMMWLYLVTYSIPSSNLQYVYCFSPRIFTVCGSRWLWVCFHQRSWHKSTANALEKCLLIMEGTRCSSDVKKTCLRGLKYNRLYLCLDGAK